MKKAAKTVTDEFYEDLTSHTESAVDRYIAAEKLLMELYDMNILALIIAGRAKIRRYLDARIDESVRKFIPNARS